MRFKRLLIGLALLLGIVTLHKKCSAQSALELGQQTGITTYLFYGGGPGHMDISGTDSFKLHRPFVDNFRHQKNDARFRTQPTWQNYKNDDYLLLLDSAGINTIWATQGTFDFLNTVGDPSKVMPINEEDDPSDPLSWAALAEYCKQVVLRYASDTDPPEYLPLVNVYDSAGDYQSNTPKIGLGLVDAIEIQNEWNFKKEWSGATRTITPAQYAACFKICYDTIRSISQIQILMGGGIGGDLNDITEFLSALDSLYGLEQKTTPTDFYLNFHWYMRDGSTDQGSGTKGH